MMGSPPNTDSGGETNVEPVHTSAGRSVPDLETRPIWPLPVMFAGIIADQALPRGDDAGVVGAR